MLQLRSKPVLAALGLLLLLAATWAWLHSPKSHVLFAESGAQWIREDLPINLIPQPLAERVGIFRTTFALQQPRPSTTLTVRAMKGVAVFVDRKPVADHLNSLESWREPRQVQLPPLGPGNHELMLVVRSTDSYPATLAHGAALGIRTGPGWEVSKDGKVWNPAMLAEHPPTPEITQTLQSSWQALAQCGPWLILVFTLAAAWSLLGEGGKYRAPEAATMRWILLAGWALLALNNLYQIPLNVGMDVNAHLAYVQEIASKGRIPLATEGWQMFQAPLAYLASAPVYLAFLGFGEDLSLHLLRVLPMLCGIAQVECCYRALKAVFPQRQDLQIAGTAFGGFLPMNLYLCQVIGNEPLAALLSSAAILLVIRQFQSGDSCVHPRFAISLGLVLGLGLLTKTTTLLLILLLPLFCLWAERGERQSSPFAPNSLRFLANVCSPILLVAGWYYLRNWILLGSPFVGGWDASRGIAYWQDHGYVPASFLYSFGTALTHPVLAQTSGVWDGLYATLWTDASLGSARAAEFRPPWNYDFMLACAPLALIPTALMVLGGIRSKRSKIVWLCLLAVALYVLAIVHLHITSVPSYATLKATYLLGLSPCLAILLARGLETLPHNPGVRALARGAMATWVFAAYAAYFVIK